MKQEAAQYNSHIYFLSNDLTREIQGFSYWVTDTIIKIRESQEKVWPRANIKAKS